MKEPGEGGDLEPKQKLSWPVIDPCSDPGSADEVVRRVVTVFLLLSLFFPHGRNVH